MIRRSKADQEGKGQTTAILRGTGPFCRRDYCGSGWTQPASLRAHCSGKCRKAASASAAGSAAQHIRRHQERHCRDWPRREEVRQPFNAIAVDLDCGTQRRIGWNMNEISRHSTDVLASYVREAERVRAARIGRDVLKREWARR
jgi:hypothetical protein